MFIVFAPLSGALGGAAIALFWWSCAMVFGFRPPSDNQVVGLIGMFVAGLPSIGGVILLYLDIFDGADAGNGKGRFQPPPRPRNGYQPQASAGPRPSPPTTGSGVLPGPSQAAVLTNLLRQASDKQ